MIISTFSILIVSYQRVLQFVIIIINFMHIHYFKPLVKSKIFPRLLSQIYSLDSNDVIIKILMQI